jgi:hydrogenase maturation protease
MEGPDLPTGLRVKQSAHDSDLMEALTLCSFLENAPKSVVVLGIEPEDIQPLGLELTETVAARMDDLVALVVKEL